MAENRYRREKTEDNEPLIDYNEKAQGYNHKGHTAFSEKNYDTAARNYGFAGKFLVEMAMNSKYSSEKMRILKDSLKEYVLAKNAILSYIQERPSKVNIKDLMERRKDLGKTIAGIEHAIEILEVREKHGKSSHNLEGSLNGIFISLAILSFIGSIITISLDMTGNVISSSSGYNQSILGILLFFLSFVFVFAYFKTRIKK